jgi:non-ribosomal peptide synthetase component E (peptide arylation enzyme)
MRNIPVELITRYEEAGWWTRETPLPTAEDVRAHFAEQGVARQKWPEILLEVADYPRTASGKVQKRLVREGIAVAFG